MTDRAGLEQCKRLLCGQESITKHQMSEDLLEAISSILRLHNGPQCARSLNSGEENNVPPEALYSLILIYQPI